MDIDKTLFLQCQRGSHAAFKKLVTEMAPYLMTICRRYIVREEDRKDVLQESFISIIHNIQQLKSYDALKSWSYRITVNQCLKHIDKQMAWFDVDTHSQIEIMNEAEMDFDAEQILTYINALPENLRLVFNMYVIDGFSYEEISTFLEIPESSCRVYVSKARKALKLALHHHHFIQPSQAKYHDIR